MIMHKLSNTNGASSKLFFLNELTNKVCISEEKCIQISLILEKIDGFNPKAESTSSSFIHWIPILYYSEKSEAYFE